MILLPLTLPEHLNYFNFTLFLHCFNQVMIYILAIIVSQNSLGLLKMGYKSLLFRSDNTETHKEIHPQIRVQNRAAQRINSQFQPQNKAVREALQQASSLQYFTKFRTSKLEHYFHFETY